MPKSVLGLKKQTNSIFSLFHYVLKSFVSQGS